MKFFMTAPNQAVSQYLVSLGYTKSDFIWDADILVYPGGGDISPSLYGDSIKHKNTYTASFTDAEQIDAYKIGRAQDKFHLGICRGAQFLHVMNGGRMYQDATGHAGKAHSVKLLYKFMNEKEQPDRSVFVVNSTHHQIMRHTHTTEKDGIEVLRSIGTPSSLVYLDHSKNWVNINSSGGELESMWYPDTSCFCFQPHPEYETAKTTDTRMLFEKLLEEFVSCTFF